MLVESKQFLTEVGSDDEAEWHEQCCPTLCSSRMAIGGRFGCRAMGLVFWPLLQRPLEVERRKALEKLPIPS